jgi:hypothetical protein
MTATMGVPEAEQDHSRDGYNTGTRRPRADPASSDNILAVAALFVPLVSISIAQHFPIFLKTAKIV